MTTNLFVIANLGSFRILLPFFRTSWCVGVLNAAVFNSFHNRVKFGTILEGLQNFGGGGFEHPKHPPSVRHCSMATHSRTQQSRYSPLSKPQIFLHIQNCFFYEYHHLSRYGHRVLCVCQEENPLQSHVVTSSVKISPATGHLDTGFSWFPCA